MKKKPQEPTARASSLRFGVGLAFLAVAAAVSLLMVIAHVRGLTLYGCGPGGGCAKATSSVWGRLPIVDWPLSHVGAAYFVALGAAWITSRGRLSGALRAIALLGAGGSLFLIAILLVKGYMCGYCLTIHLANLAFCTVVAMGEGDKAPAARRSLTGAVTVFAIATVVLIGVELIFKERAERIGRDDLARSTQAIIEGGGEDGEAPGDPFIGRYPLGPERAAIRIVSFLDYQCPDCRLLEQDIMEIFHERDDVSVSIKQFPFCKDCNRWVPENMHPNACWAARAAETAGLLRGGAAFWEMHEWLFEREGSFEYDPLKEHVLREGYDFKQWSEVMQGDETLQLVLADIDEAVDLGIRQTPLIFVNGVELEGWRIKGAVRTMVDSVAATNPPARTSEFDRPAKADARAVAAWREIASTRLPSDARPWPIGNPQGTITVTVWGDYQEPYTAQVDGIIRGFMDGRDDVRYDFRHYPINLECNPSAKVTKHDQACMAHRASEAAGALGGREGYERVHTWLMANQKGLTRARFDAALPGLGFDPVAFAEAMERAETEAEIVRDSAAGKRLGMTSIPRIYVNDKRIAAWKFAKVEALTPILHAAAEESGP